METRKGRSGRRGRSGTRVAWVLALAGVLALAATAVAPPVRAQDPKPGDPLPSVSLPADLERVLRDYETAWAAGDGAALARLFTEDGFVRRRGWIRGRDAIRRRYDQVAGGALRLRALEHATDGAAGWVVGAYGYGQGDAGVFVLAVERSSHGRWLIAADLDHGVGPGP